MNEFTKDSPTSEKLVAELGTKTDITICADIVHGLDYEYKQLQQKNQELKKQLEEKNKTKIFVEQNLEEAYGEGLYLEHLENKNQKYKETIDKAIKYIEKNMNQKLYTGEEIFDTYSPATDLLNILEEVE